MTMNIDIKAQWLTALRSGDYRQGTGVLRTADDQYCCLGVLCDLAEKAGVVAVHLPIGNHAYFYGDDEGGTDTVLPQVVEDWAGLDGENPWVKHDGKSDAIAELNDKGATFSQLADLIEEQL